MSKKRPFDVVNPGFNRKMCWVSFVVMALILVVPSLQCITPECRSPTDGSTISSYAPDGRIGVSSVEPLPAFDFHLHFKDSVIGVTWIDAPITMSVTERHNISTGAVDLYLTGYKFDYIAASDPLLAPGLLGIGFDWYACYWYSYNSSGKVYDEWEDGNPAYSSNGKGQFWTTTGSDEIDMGSAFPAAMQGAVRFGEYLWLHDIRLYFQGNVSVLCSPDSLLLWADFQWNTTNWTVSSQIWDSLNKQTVLGSRNATLSVGYPVDPAKTTIIIAVPSILAVMAYWKRDTLRARVHRKSSIGLEGSEYCYH